MSGLPATNCVAVTTLDDTTVAVARIKERLAERGLEAMIFHSDGVGGPAMEELAEQGMFAGVIDYVTGELSNQLMGGIYAGGERRLERVGAVGLPQVVVPGCIDFALYRLAALPKRLRSGPVSYHSSELTSVRLTQEEMEEVARIIARKLNGARGPLKVIVPTRGLSKSNTPGGLFWNPQADAAFLRALADELRAHIPLITVEAHINDPLFVDRVADEFAQLLSQAPAVPRGRQLA